MIEGKKEWGGGGKEGGREEGKGENGAGHTGVP